jgi:hypothetical protein
VFPTGQSSGFYGSLPSHDVHVNDIVRIATTPAVAVGGLALLPGILLDSALLVLAVSRGVSKQLSELL